MTENQTKPKDSLFRKESIENLKEKRYGSVLLTRPVSHTFLVSSLLAIALGVVAFFVIFSYQRKIQVSGVLLPESGLIKVSSVQGGIIVQKSAKEAQSVKAGDVLFVMESDRESPAGGMTGTSTSILMRTRQENLAGDIETLGRQSAERTAAANQKMAAIYLDIDKLESQLVLQRQRVEIASDSYRQFSALQGENFVSPAQIQTKKAELIDQRQRLADLERAIGSAKRELADVKASKKDIELQSQREVSAIERNISSVAQELSENEARRQVVVRAPINGTLNSIAFGVGQLANPGATMALIQPEGESLLADLFIPSRAMGFVKPGMKVRLRYQSYPYQKFGQHDGVVKEVMGATLSTSDTSLQGQDVFTGPNKEPLYRVRVVLPNQYVLAYGNKESLRPGMIVDASIMTESRRIFEWVLEPLYAITGKI